MSEQDPQLSQAAADHLADRLRIVFPSPTVDHQSALIATAAP
jgi:hypothetical protein